MASTDKTLCKYGDKCFRKNEEHLRQFYHPKKCETTTNVKRPTPEQPKPPKALKQTKLNFGRSKDQGPSINNQKNQNKPTVLSKVITPKNKRIRLSEDSHVSESEDESANDVTSNSWTYFRASNIEESSVDDTSKAVSSSESESEEEDTFRGNTVKEKIKYLFYVDMPEDFYSFYDFCQTLNEKNPLAALNQFNIKLVGPFDVLAGKLNPGEITRDKALCHWRFYMDPPEMQTVLIAEEGLHYGYWRDEPDSVDTFVVSNTVPDCRILPTAPNIFGAVSIHMQAYIRRCSPFEKVKATNTLTSIKKWAEEKGFNLSDSNSFMKSRKRKVVASTFHGLGIVVDVDPKTELGYRPLIETYGNIKKTCQAIMKADDPLKRQTLMEPIEQLINAANIANDECDFGNGLELGINLFCMGSDIFHNTVEHLLTTAYFLLNRPAYTKIIRAHLKWRRTNLELSAIS